jgi:C-terminal binding protein
LSAGLWPTGQTKSQPWSSLPEELRRRVNGIMVLKIAFTAADVLLFPNLNV